MALELGAISALFLLLLGSAALQLLSVSHSREALRELGLNGKAADVASVALPTVEVGLAIGLLVPAAAEIALISAAVLFLIYACGLTWALRRGRRPKCHCFGSLSTRTISLWTVARCLACMTIGALAAWPGNPEKALTVSYAHPMAVVTACAGLFLAVSLLALGMLCLELSREQLGLLTRLRDVEDVLIQSGLSIRSAEASPTGEIHAHIASKLPLGNLSRADGAPLKLPADKPSVVMLVLVELDCAGCLALIPDAVAWAQSEDLPIRVLLVTEATPAPFDGFGFSHLDFFYDKEGQLTRALSVKNRPAALLILSDGRVQTDIAVGPRSIKKLFAQALADADRSRTVPNSRISQPVSKPQTRRRIETRL